MHKEATTSGAFNPSTLESFEQIALVGVPHTSIVCESWVHPYECLLANCPFTCSLACLSLVQISHRGIVA